MLTIYRASAGAGKTHKLTGEYLKLLFLRTGNYRRILAVTFTNKATDEMKRRIIDELYRLSAGQPSDYLHLLGEDEKQVRDTARRILIDILHDYASFNISTIDRFFQQTMRAFTREIGLQGGYAIEMDQDLVLTEAVDRLLADLEKPENKELLGWMLAFAEDKIDTTGEWNLRRDIMSLGNEIFKEKYKAYSDRIHTDIEDKKTLEEYRKGLYAIIRQAEGEVRRIGEEAMAILASSGLKPTDFTRKTNSPVKHFEKYARGEMKEPTATFINLADDVDAYYNPKDTPPEIVARIREAYPALNGCVTAAIALFSDLSAYYTAKEIVRFYYVLGILNDIAGQVAAYREDKNIMLIADTTELLNKVIDGSDAPFLYEKTGTHVDHYMIDEFQDTSRMQWKNFRPLIRESLAHAHDNLIVGDVKQSIYRFRNSDWKLLDEQVQQDFLREQVGEETLKDNWRSHRHIVEFNNAFFHIAPSLLQVMYNEVVDESSLTDEAKQEYLLKIVSAYRDAWQEIPAKFRKLDGHVRIDFISEEDDDWKEESLRRLPACLEQLQDNGYPLKDIAILVRTNQEGAQVAETLLAWKEEHPGNGYRYDIISDDSLFIGSSASVRFIITLLQYLKNTDDATRRQMALFAYAALTGRFGGINAGSDFPADVNAALQELTRQSLYEITEGLFRLFQAYFPSNEQVFVQAFFDLVADYSQKESPDLIRFLKYWEETGCKKTVATPDGQDAIRILTIHKSKGLGFKVVILPFADWEIDHRGGSQVVLWCEPKQAPFDRLHLVPVRYGQTLAKTIFAREYFEEKLHASIDSLNTLYVAFTRAKEELIVCAPRPKKLDKKTGAAEKISSVAPLLWNSLFTADDQTDGGNPLIPLSASFNPDEGLFELGEPWHPAASGSKEGKTEEIPSAPFTSTSPGDRLRLRLNGKNFCFDNPQRKYGALMHDILGHIRTPDDIPAVIAKYRLAGVVDGEEAAGLQSRLDALLASPGVAPWFDGSRQVLNEVDILYSNGQTRRPDRILIRDGEVTVVDYKFGTQEDRRYPNQVRNYMKLIRRMGYPDVKGFLWYVELDKIEAVID